MVFYIFGRCYHFINPHRDGRAVSTWGGGLILNDIRSHQHSSTYHLSSGIARVKSWGAKQGCTREGTRGKIGSSIGGKLQNGSNARAWDIDLLFSSVSPPPHGESFMSYEVLNK